jgi:hypothetical protein
MAIWQAKNALTCENINFFTVPVGGNFLTGHYLINHSLKKGRK